MATQLERDAPTYQPQNALGESMSTAVYFGGLGFAVSAVQNALTRRNVGTWGVFGRTGAAIGLFSAVGGAFTFTQLASANLREKNDTYNTVIGGFVAGAVGSLRVRTFPALLGYGAVFSVLMSAYEFTGSRLFGSSGDPEQDEYDRKEARRLTRRRPITETLQELGEGRGIRGPGYEERRRERIKQNYGIDVNPSPSQAA